MESTLSRVSRAKSEIKRRDSISWGEAAIDVRCRLFLSELDWPWTTLGPSEVWTPVEEVHALSEYSLSDDILCDVCRRFNVAEDQIHQLNGASLMKAASEGCQLCNMILDSFEGDSDRMDILLRHNKPIILEYRHFEGIGTLSAGYDGPIPHKDESRYFKAHRPLVVCNEDDPSIYRGKASTIEFIGNRLAECMSKHESCASTLVQPLPLRLVDVGCPGGDEEHQPRLWINQWHGRGADATDMTKPPSGVYAALSYCWGNQTFLTLTAQTLQSLQKFIPMEKLPPTLQDAIEVTRGLGIQYLWIDALCIYQDQSAAAKTDWAEQSVQMDSIYNQAAIVLGVASSSNTLEGIQCQPYHYRDIVEVNPLQTTGSAGDAGRLRRRFVVSRGFKAEHTLGPLYTRGWTYQERILAARYVHLGREKMFFECDHGRQYEYYKEEQFQFKLGTRVSSRSHFDQWQELAEEYSQRQLTVPTDNLIAISGIAKRFAAKSDRPNNYLSGLWEASLVRDLMWCVETPTKRIDIAPSWSWAARRTAITYGSIRRHICTAKCAKLVDTNVTNFPGLYGFRSSGEIRVKGYLRKIFLHGEQDRYQIIGFQAHGPNATDTMHVIGNCVMDFPNAERSLTRVSDRFVDQEDPSWNNIFEVWCLVLHPGRGLLLEATGRNLNEFERIAYFEYPEQRYPGSTMPVKDLVSSRDPMAQAAYLAENPPAWIEAVMEAGHHDLVEDWFGDPEAIVTLV